MIAVNQRYQRQGLGRVLLANALKRSVVAADQGGVKTVILDVVDDGGPEIAERRRVVYAAMGFWSFPSRPSRMFLPVETIRRARSGLGGPPETRASRSLCSIEGYPIDAKILKALGTWPPVAEQRGFSTASRLD